MKEKRKKKWKIKKKNVGANELNKYIAYVHENLKQV